MFVYGKWDEMNFSQKETAFMGIFLRIYTEGEKCV